MVAGLWGSQSHCLCSQEGDGWILVLRPQPMEWCYPQLGWAFSPLLAQSGIFLSGTCSAAPAHGLELHTVRVTFLPLLAQSRIFLPGTCSACLPGDSSACQVDSQYERLEQQVHLVANSSQSHGGLQRFSSHQPAPVCTSFVIALVKQTPSLGSGCGVRVGAGSIWTPSLKGFFFLTFFFLRRAFGKDVSRCLNSNVFLLSSFFASFPSCSFQL